MSSSTLNSNSPKIYLKHSISGLTVEWNNVDKRSQKLYMLISTSAIKGEIFEAYNISSKIISLLPKSFSTSNLHIIACDSGEVILVSLGNNGNYIHICHSQGNIIWANFINDYFVLVERSGRISLGTFGNQIHSSSGNMSSSLKWRSVSLSLTPISCTGLKNILILCDENNTYLYKITDDPSQELPNKLQPLTFSGIIQVERVGLHVLLTTYYGKKYVQSFEDIEINVQTGCIGTRLPPYPDFYVEDAMKTLMKFAEAAKAERSELEKMNTYLEQLCVAQLLIQESPTKLFGVTLSASFTSATEGYLLSIALKELGPYIKFHSPWWQLNVKLKGCLTVNCAYENVNQQNGSSSDFEVSMLIPFSFVEELVSNCQAIVKLEFYFTFSHISLQKPICVLKIQEEPLDILHFLTSTKEATLPPLFTSSFLTKVSKMFGHFRERASFAEEPQISYYKSSLILMENYKPLLEKLFPPVSLDTNQMASLTQWLQDVRLHLTFEKFDDYYYKVSIESLSRETAVAVKCALERRALGKDKERSRKVQQYLEYLRLPPDLRKKSEIMNVMLNLETSSDNMLHTNLRATYEAIVELMASVPF